LAIGGAGAFSAVKTLGAARAAKVLASVIVGQQVATRALDKIDPSGWSSSILNTLLLVAPLAARSTKFNPPGSQEGWKTLKLAQASEEQLGLHEDVANAKEVIIGRSTNIKGRGLFVFDEWLTEKGIKWSQEWQDVFNRAVHDRVAGGKPVNVLAGGGFTEGEVGAAEAGARVSGTQNLPFWPDPASPPQPLEPLPPGTLLRAAPTGLAPGYLSHAADPFDWSKAVDTGTGAAVPIGGNWTVIPDENLVATPILTKHF
jgi:hypothetical protein